MIEIFTLRKIEGVFSVNVTFEVCSLPHYELCSLPDPNDPGFISMQMTHVHLLLQLQPGTAAVLLSQQFSLAATKISLYYII